MVKKVQKINQKKNTKEKKEGGFKFGRNLGSFLIVISGLVLLFFMVFIPYSYISAYTANKSEPFAEKTIYTDYLANIEKNSETNPKVYREVKRMRGKDFNLFDVKFECLKFNSSSHEASFSLEVKWNENSSKLSESSETLVPIENSSHKTMKAMVGIPTSWIKWESDTYSSQRTLEVTNSPESDRGKTTFSISNLPDYPEKANTWPIKVTVTNPSAYVFLTFGYNDDKIGTVYEAYILEYTYDEYMKDTTNGAIPNKKVNKEA